MNEDICRVCRGEGQTDHPLFHPCICTGSIKWIHQDCLTMWMQYSKKEHCELCGHQFSFAPIYSPDMPQEIPMRYVVGGILERVGRAIKYSLHCILVLIAWLGIVPLSAYKIYDSIFAGSLLDIILSLPFNILFLPIEILTNNNVVFDFFKGCIVIIGTLILFIVLVWLRDQILVDGGPDWLELIEAVVANEVFPEFALLEPFLDENIINEADLEALVDMRMDIEEPLPADLDDEDADEDLANEDEEEAHWNLWNWEINGDLAWERLTGLDGSMDFIEHIFWVLSVVIVFIFAFAFMPYCVGSTMISSLGLIPPTEEDQIPFQGLLTTFCGYCNIGLALVILHSLAGLFRKRKWRMYLGLGFIVVKVLLLSVIEIFLLPLACGWWMDICMLPMFNATINERTAIFYAVPAYSTFIHWMFGTVFIYYISVILSLVREILRPDVQWFLQNFNNPNFGRIQEMIHSSILNNTRRLAGLTIIFGFAVFLMLWMPIKMLKTVYPSIFWHCFSDDSAIKEINLQLLLLQIIFPYIMEHSHIKIWLKRLLQIWFNAVSSLLGIRSYLLVTEQEDKDENVPGLQPEHGQGLEDVHEEPCEKPTFVPVRLFGLIALMCLTLVIGSLLTITVPIWIGWQVVKIQSVLELLSENFNDSDTPVQRFQLFTALFGTYVCWLLSRVIEVMVNLLPQGRTAVMQKVKHWIYLGASYILTGIIFFGVIPLLFGLLIELVVLIPMRVPLDQTPIHFIFQDWMLGLVHTTLSLTIILIGPDSNIKRIIHRVYRNGLLEIDLKFIARELAMPVVVFLGLALALPYVIAHSLVPIIIKNQDARNLITRGIYPLFLIILTIIAIINLEIRHVKKLYTAIRNDKYLVGQRLVNYDHRR